MKTFLLTGLAAPLIAVAAFGQNAHSSNCCSSNPRADGHGPIGVMGDHTHAAGGWMFSYRYMSMSMSGLRDGTSSLSESEVLMSGTGSYMIAPQDMTMTMHMFGGMYSVHDDLTLMVMVPYLEKDMDLTRITMAGTGEFNTKTSGLGDITLSALPVLWRSDHEQLHLNLGLSLPTGSITETDGVLQMDGTTLMELRLPYSMQLGTGTVDLKPGVTYVNHGEGHSWGAQASGTIHLGTNNEDYSFGDALSATTWGAMRVGEEQSVSLRLNASWAGDIDGADPVIAPLAGMNPLADTRNYGGKRAEVGLGWNWQPQGETLSGHRLAAELIIPIYEDLEGPQMEREWSIVIGWQYAF